MRIIDLLDKIANGEEPPKKIIFRDVIYQYAEEDKDYYNNECDGLFDYYEITDIINEVVLLLETTITYNQDKEIIKEYVDDYILNPDKIEYLNIEKDRYNAEKLFNKINEIIEKVNNL